MNVLVIGEWLDSLILACHLMMSLVCFLVIVAIFNSHWCEIGANGKKRPVSIIYKILKPMFSARESIRIELPLPYENWILNPARLPVPPQGHNLIVLYRVQRIL